MESCAEFGDGDAWHLHRSPSEEGYFVAERSKNTIGDKTMEMTEDEIKSFLAENKMMHLASVGPDGGPRVVPVSFMHENGKFYVSTPNNSRKVNNIKKNNKVAFNVDRELRAVVVKGTARIISPGDHDELLKKLIMYLVGSLEHPYAKVMMQPDRVIIEITPTSVRGWNTPPV